MLFTPLHAIMSPPMMGPCPAEHITLIILINFTEEGMHIWKYIEEIRMEERRWISALLLAGHVWICPFLFILKELRGTMVRLG